MPGHIGAVIWARRHRLHALALTKRRQASAAILQWIDPIGVNLVLARSLA